MIIILIRVSIGYGSFFISNGLLNMIIIFSKLFFIHAKLILNNIQKIF